MHQELGGIEAVTGDLVCKKLTAGRDIVGAGFTLEPGIDLGLGVGSARYGDPVARRALDELCGRLDLNDVAVLQLIGQRDDSPVDLGAVHVIADARVDRISEVDRTGALGELDY